MAPPVDERGAVAVEHERVAQVGQPLGHGVVADLVDAGRGNAAAVGRHGGIHFDQPRRAGGAGERREEVLVGVAELIEPALVQRC